MNHSPAPWRIGNGSFIVSDQPGDGLVSGSEDYDHYGGYLVCESVSRANAELIVGAVNVFSASSGMRLLNMNGLPLTLASIHKILAVLCETGSVTIINGAKRGAGHAGYLLGLMRGTLSDQDKVWLEELLDRKLKPAEPVPEPAPEPLPAPDPLPPQEPESTGVIADDHIPF
jgi:hypothetical protein